MIVPESSVKPVSEVPHGDLIRARVHDGWVIATVAHSEEQPDLKYLVALATNTRLRVPGWIEASRENQPVVSYGRKFDLVLAQESDAYKFGIDTETRGALFQTANSALLHVGPATDYGGHWSRFYDFASGLLVRHPPTGTYVGVLRWKLVLRVPSDSHQPGDVLAQFGTSHSQES